MTLDYSPETMPVVMRSVMYTPGNNPRLVQKARTLTVDVIVLDLEDSVPPSEKVKARDMVRDAISTIAESGADVYVRVNAWNTGLTSGDLEVVVQRDLDGIVLPKTESAEDLANLDNELSALEEKNGLNAGVISVQPIIETARGILNAYQSVSGSERVNSLAFGAVDYARDMRVQLTREGRETLYARSQVAIAARALGVVAVDSAWPAYADMEGFVSDSRVGRQLGYEGRILIHPNQIEAAHSIYAPTQEEVERAREIIEVFEDGVAKGLASVPLRGSMIDWPVYRAARDVLAKADLIAQKEKARRDKRR